MLLFVDGYIQMNKIYAAHKILKRVEALDKWMTENYTADKQMAIRYIELAREWCFRNKEQTKENGHLFFEDKKIKYGKYADYENDIEVIRKIISEM